MTDIRIAEDTYIVRDVDNGDYYLEYRVPNKWSWSRESYNTAEEAKTAYESGQVSWLGEK